MTVETRRRRPADTLPADKGGLSEPLPPTMCPSSLAASSLPILLRLAHRHESSSHRHVSPPIAMPFFVLLIAALINSPLSVTAADDDDSIPAGVLMDEPITATIAPTSCPDACSCFFTFMYCFGIDRIPPVISPATKFVHIYSSSFASPVLSRANFSSGYENVEDIAIQYTNLAGVQNQAFDNLRRVRYISLDHNQLRTLPSSMLRVFARAKSVSLFSNQWNCNRDLAWLYEVYRSNPDKFGAGCLDTDCRFVSQVRCDSPVTFRALDFVNITFTQYQQMQAAN